MSDEGRRLLREVLSNHPTGVVLITAVADDGRPAGMAVGSFVSVSLDPPLIAYLPRRESSTYQRVRTAPTFCVNILSDAHEALCREFAAQSEEDKFAGLQWTLGESGAPRIPGSLAWLECRTTQVIEAGDHYIVIGEVIASDHGDHGHPLIFFQSDYGRFQGADHDPAVNQELLRWTRAIAGARPAILRWSLQLGVTTDIVALAGNSVVVLESSAEDHGDALAHHAVYLSPHAMVHLRDEDARAAWRRRFTSGMNDEAAEDVEARLERLAARGWSVALSGDEHSEHSQLVGLLDRGTRTPRVERQLLAAGRSLLPLFEPEDAVLEGRPAVHRIAVPIQDTPLAVIVRPRVETIPLNDLVSVTQGLADELQEALDA